MGFAQRVQYLKDQGPHNLPGGSSEAIELILRKRILNMPNCFIQDLQAITHSRVDLARKRVVGNHQVEPSEARQVVVRSAPIAAACLRSIRVSFWTIPVVCR